VCIAVGALMAGLVARILIRRRPGTVAWDLVADVSHELKTPVGAMTLLAEAVLDAADDPHEVRTRNACSSGSSASIRHAADLPAALGWGWRSSSTSPPATEVMSSSQHTLRTPSTPAGKRYQTTNCNERAATMVAIFARKLTMRTFHRRSPLPILRQRLGVGGITRLPRIVPAILSQVNARSRLDLKSTG
jgi:hypothetical protein